MHSGCAKTLRDRFDPVCGGEVSGDPDTLADAKIRVEVDAESIQTSNKGRDEHLRSADFFNVGKHPKIVFTSTAVKDREHRREDLAQGSGDAEAAARRRPSGRARTRTDPQRLREP